MTLLLKEPLRGDDEDLVLDRGDRAIGACEASPDGEPEPQFPALEPTGSGEISAEALAGGSAASDPADRSGSELTPSSAILSRNSAPFSRGLVDAYFRQMGDAALLSREEEIALAKRIEAWQQAMLTGLCRVPMLIERTHAGGARSLKDDLIWPILSICPSSALGRTRPVPRTIATR